MWSQVVLRKQYYEWSYWRWWNSSWANSNPKRWCCESAALYMSANLENSPVVTGLEKISFHSNPKEGHQKCSNYHTIVLISHATKVMLKILQARLQQFLNWELPDVQAGFRKGRGIKLQIANIHWIMEKAKEFQKSIYFCSLTILKPLTVWITTNCGKFLKSWDFQTTLSVS